MLQSHDQDTEEQHESSAFNGPDVRYGSCVVTAEREDLGCHGKRSPFWSV